MIIHPQRVIVSVWWLTWFATGLVNQTTWAQQRSPGLVDLAEPTVGSPRYGEPQASRYRVGIRIHAKRGTVGRIVGMVAVPLTCQEQQVVTLEEDITEQPHISFRNLGGVEQMLLKIGRLSGGEVAHAINTYEVNTCPILPPLETAHLHIPKKPSRKLKRYLTTSPYIEVGHRKIRAALNLALENLDAKATDWQRVEAIYDYVQNTITYLEGPDKSAVAALTDQKGDCQAISALFVAMCRTKKIPARIVWVHEHNYPEFYLAEGKIEKSETVPESTSSTSELALTTALQGGEQAAESSLPKIPSPKKKSSRRQRKVAEVGHWYPCESSGRRAFGEMPLTRTVLQKGDNFRIPERPKERLRYASDYLTGLPTPGGGKPQVEYIREQL